MEYLCAFSTGRPGVQTIDLPQKSTFQFGLELEYILAFNGARWSIFTEPIYRTYEAALTTTIDYEYNVGGVVFNSTVENSFLVNYRSVEILIGFRYHVFPKRAFKLFASVAYAFEIPINRTQSSGSRPTSYTRVLELNPEHITYVGLGANYKHKYSIEFRYGFPRELVNTYKPWKSFYNTFSVILGYNFL